MQHLFIQDGRMQPVSGVAKGHGFRAKRSCQTGFTLIELMVTVALVAILVVIAQPSWERMQTGAILRSATNDLSSSLQIARSEATRLKSPVTLCPSSDGSTCTDNGFDAGWIVRTGPATDATGQVVLQDVLPRSRVRIDATGATPTRTITFLPNGLPAGNFSGITISVCPNNTHLADITRNTVIARTGRIRLVKPGSCPLS